MMRIAICLGMAILLGISAYGQTKVGVELEEVVDNRVSIDPNADFQLRGGLEVRVKMTGTGLDKALAARIVITDAKDDKGTSLMEKARSLPDFSGREYNNGTLSLTVGQPARTASSVRIKGNVELYVPDRDPNANVKIPNAFAKLDAPISSKALKSANVELTLLSPAGYNALVKSRKITDKDIEELRAAGKKEGATDKEIETVIELAKAMEGLDEALPPNGVALSGTRAAFDRIYRIEILGSDGQPVNVGSRGTTTRGDSSVMTLAPSELPDKATLQVLLLTDKSRMSFPFDLKVQLP
jgi:hypothetical protein